MRRFLKIVTILALFAVVVAYVAFRILFFDPFGGARPSLDPLVPKDVDVLVRRADLARDFDPFPLPAFFRTLRLKDEWEALARTKLYRETVPKLGIEELFRQAGTIPAQMQPLDLMKDFAGREVMVLGRWRPDGTLAYAALGRGSFRAKFGAEAIGFALARKLAGSAIGAYEEKEGIRIVTVQGQAWHVWRTDDVVVLGNDFALVKEIQQLAEKGGLSLNESPQYRASILPPTTLGRPLDFVLDVGELGRQLGLEWPAQPDDAPALRKFGAALFTPAHFGQVMGRFQLGQKQELSLRATTDFAAIEPLSGGIFGAPSTELAPLHQFCGTVFPPKVAITGYVRLEVKAFLRRLESLLDKDTRELLNDFIPQLRGGAGFQPKSTVELLDLFAEVVGDELAFALEPNEAYHIPGTPENEMQFPEARWGPRLALVFPTAEDAAARQLVDRLIEALRKRPNIVNNVWVWGYPGGHTFREIKFLDSDMPTLSIGFLELMKRPCLIVTTTGAFFDGIVQQKVMVEEHKLQRGLGAEVQYRQAQEMLTGTGHGFVFLSAPSLHDVLKNLCVVFAEDGTRPDWSQVRKEVTAQVLATKYPELVGRKLSAADNAKVEADVDAVITGREKTWQEETVPRATEALHEDLGGLQMLRWAALKWRVHDRDLEVTLRMATPASFP